MLETFSINCPFQSISCQFLSAVLANKLFVHANAFWSLLGYRESLYKILCFKINSFFWSLCVVEMEQGKAKGEGEQHGFVRSSHLWQTLGGGSKVQAHHTIHSFWSSEGEYFFSNILFTWELTCLTVCIFLRFLHYAYEFFYRSMDLWPGKQSGTWCPRELSDL